MINLYINYFKHSDKKRHGEIAACLLINLSNPLIDRIVVLAEDTLPLEHPKLVVLPTNKRPTYQDFFNLTKSYPEEDINILSNSDIAFNETLVGVNSLVSNTCYAITRHEIRGGVPVPFRAANGCPPHFSQDVWIFRGAVKLENCTRIEAYNNRTKVHEQIDFTMGVPGCDNLIAFYLARHYRLKNPHDIILCLHHHEDSKRPFYLHRMTGDKSKWGQLLKVMPSQL